jgi:hypothetical protein
VKRDSFAGSNDYSVQKKRVVNSKQAEGLPWVRHEYVETVIAQPTSYESNLTRICIHLHVTEQRV